MITIVEATPDGIPSKVVCTVCEPDPASVWVRPAEDHTAGTLPHWIRIHDRRPRQLALAASR